MLTWISKNNGLVMKTSTLVYNNYLNTKGSYRRFWSVLRKLLIKILHDPSCTLTLHGKPLHLPLSHALPIYLKQYQFYDRLPGRISEYMHDKYGFIKCIDVGANIGDTIAAFYKDEKDRFLAIEANKKYWEYLLVNWGSNANIKTQFCLCTSESGTNTFNILEKAGTAAAVYSERGSEIETRSLDDLVASNPSFADFNILKIDTDGYDFEVIEGAKNIISNRLPIILFECDSFSNSNYINDCLKILKLFEDCGYNQFLLYDNFGHLMGKYSLADSYCFRNLLFFQLTSSFYYFDILIMKDDDIIPFLDLEITYFIDKMSDKSLQQIAKAAAELYQ